MASSDTPKKSKQRAYIVYPDVKGESVRRDPKYRLEEAVGLAQAIDLEVVCADTVTLQRIIPATYMGKGKVEELADAIAELEAGLFIIDTHISPIQQRNLEKALKCKVIDRTALILEIFGERARTKEGKLQVELAAYQYQKSRLVRSWTHLERQRGGGGFMGGPGERQIESDRRAINDRIHILKRQLQKVVKTRELHRASRRKIPYDLVCLVGYTNAGKSTLFNRLTESKVFAKDLLFATLDPTMRVLDLPSGRPVILSDTVGFISDLPTELVAAFRATLEELYEAALIIHVRDASHHESHAQKMDVLQVIKDLGLDEDMHKHHLEALNKIDLIEEKERKELLLRNKDKKSKIMISAQTGEGCYALLEAIDEALNKGNITKEVTLDAGDGKAIAWLHAHSKILSETINDDKIDFKISIAKQQWGKFCKMVWGGGQST